MPQLPANQDVVVDRDIVIDLLGWTDGPLPKQEMELAAWELFCDSHPGGLWTDRGYSEERNKCRRQILRAYTRFLKMDRWTLSNMIERLEAGFGGLVFGDRGSSPTEQRELHAYAVSCIEELFARFMGDRKAARQAVAPAYDQMPWSVPCGQGIDDAWRQAYVASKFADVLTDLTCPGTPFSKLDVKDRAWLRGQTEQLVEDAVARFQSHPGDPGYRPQDEPEYDFEGRTEDEQ